MLTPPGDSYARKILRSFSNPIGFDYPLNKDHYDDTTLEICNGYSTTGWATVGAAADTTNKYQGNNTLRFTGNSSSPYGTKTLSVAVDLSTYDYFDVYIYIHDYVSNQITLRMRTSGTDYYQFLLSDYYKPSYLDRKVGWKRIRVPKAIATTSGSPDWANITSVFILFAYNAGETGYDSLAKINAVGINKALISVDFDDGEASVYSVAYPLLKAAGIAAAAYVNTSTIGTAGKMTWKQLRTLRDDGWLIGCHSHNHYDLTAKTTAEIQVELDTCQEYLRNNGLYIGTYFIATPNGTMSQAVMDEVKKRFIGARYTMATDNPIPPVSSLKMMYLSVANTDTEASLEGLVAAAVSAKRWHTFTFHDIVASPSVATQYATADFTTFVSYLAAQVTAGTIEVVTPLDVILQSDGATLDNIIGGIKPLLHTVRNI